MYLRWKKYARKTGAAYALQAVETLWVPGKGPRQKVVDHLGTLPVKPTETHCAQLWERVAAYCSDSELDFETRDKVVARVKARCPMPPPTLGASFHEHEDGKVWELRCYLVSTNAGGVGTVLATLGRIADEDNGRDIRRFWTDVHGELAKCGLEPEVRSRIEEQVARRVRPLKFKDVLPVEMWRPDALTDLGVHPGAPLRDIKRGWRRRAHEHHPDRGGSRRAFEHFKEAWDLCKALG